MVAHSDSVPLSCYLEDPAAFRDFLSSNLSLSPGVVEGISVAGEELRYGEEELALLRRARRLHHDLDINMEGVEVILRLQARLEALQRELEQYRRRQGNIR